MGSAGKNDEQLTSVNEQMNKGGNIWKKYKKIS